jgi:hypothetical protein
MALRWAPAVALLSLVLSSVRCTSGILAQDEVPSERTTRRVVVLDSSQCAGIPATELHELMALELAPRALRLPGDVDEDADVTRAQLRCDANSARLVVREATRSPQELVLDLSSIDVRARARLLALTLAELLATAELEGVPPAALPAPERADDGYAPWRSAARSSGWLGAGLVREGRPRVLAPSLQTGLVSGLGSLPLALIGELQVQRGERDVSAGRVTVWTASGSLGPAAIVPAGPFDLGLGVAARVGYARLIGEADAGQASIAGHAVSGFWWGPTLAASAIWRLRARLGLRAGVDLTWVARAVRGVDSANTLVYELDGLIVHATLGVSLALPAWSIGRRKGP